jgi:hypothetical protein
MVTASTTLFGAPFWFDLLQRAVQMRGTGSKPEERRHAVRIDGQLTGNAEAAKPTVVAAA